MKLLLLLSACCCSFTAKSQAAKIQVYRSNVFPVLNDSLQDPHKPFTALRPPATYKFLFQSGKGKVYESPVDQMRYLSTDLAGMMPVAGNKTMLIRPMPNPMPGNPEIPKPIKP